MSTDLVLTGQRPSYLPAVPTAVPAAQNPYLAGMSAGALLPTLSIRGKEFSVRKGEEEFSLGYEVSVILLGSRPNLSKRFYGSGYTPGERTLPRCASDDGVTPYSPSGDGVIAPACAGCPNNVFGTGKNAQGQATRGKACQDFRRIVVYPLVEISGSALHQAMILDIPPTSLRAKKGEPPAYSEFTRMLGDHGALVPAGDRMVGAVVAKLSFQRGVESPRIVWTAERWATPEEIASASELAVEDEVTETLTVTPPTAAASALAPADRPSGHTSGNQIGWPSPGAHAAAVSYGTGPASPAPAPAPQEAAPAAEANPLASSDLVEELRRKLAALEGKA